MCIMQCFEVCPVRKITWPTYLIDLVTRMFEEQPGQTSSAAVAIIQLDEVGLLMTDHHCFGSHSLKAAELDW